MRPLDLPDPTEEQLTELETLYDQTRNVRLRTSAQMILLALEEGLRAPAIAEIVCESEETVRRWLKRWKAGGKGSPQNHESLRRAIA